MSTRKTIMMLLAAALMALVIPSLGLVQTQEYHQTTEIADFQKERGGYSVTMTSSYKVSPGGDLRMEDLVGDVNINGGNSKEVEIIEEFFFDVDTEREAQSAFERYRATISQTGNRIRVQGQDLERRRYVTTTYRVKVPMKFNVDVETMGGDVRLEQLEGTALLETLGGDVEVNEVQGNLEIETAGGDINVTGIAGEADLETAGGDVELDGARSGPFWLKTAGGDITLRSVEGDVDAETSGGDVEVRQVTGNLDLHTSGGDITLEEVKGKSHTARTSGGDVEAENVEGELELRTSGGDVAATMIAGNVYGRTSGGDIEIFEIGGDLDVSTSGGSLDLKAITGRLVGKTSGGDVKATVQGQGMLKAPIRLSTSGGEITLELPADVKATVDAQIRTRDPFSNYTISSDFKLNIEEEDEHEHGYRLITAKGDINGGGPLIELETAEGNIYIEKR